MVLVLEGAQNAFRRRFPTPKACGFHCVLFKDTVPALYLRVWVKYNTGLPGNTPLLYGSFERPESPILEASIKKP